MLYITEEYMKITTTFEPNEEMTEMKVNKNLMKDGHKKVRLCKGGEEKMKNVFQKCDIT